MRSPLRSPLPAGERSEHPAAPLSEKETDVLQSSLGSLPPSARVVLSGSGQVPPAAASGAQESDFSPALPSRTGPLPAYHRPLRHNEHNEH